MEWRLLLNQIDFAETERNPPYHELGSAWIYCTEVVKRSAASDKILQQSQFVGMYYCY